jgi:hypothetical protein
LQSGNLLFLLMADLQQWLLGQWHESALKAER